MGISVLNPMEVIKTQIQASSSKTSAADVFARIWRTDGILGFWAGLSLGFSFCYRLVQCTRVLGVLFLLSLGAVHSCDIESQKYHLPLFCFLSESNCFNFPLPIPC